MSQHTILTPDAHRDLRVHSGHGETYGDGVMCCVTVPDEFRRVQNEYPILFRLNPDRDSFAALAMFGFENGENLFLDDGCWDARYRPLAMTIQPFLIGRPSPESRERHVHVDMASPRIGADGDLAVFDADGKPTSYLERVSEQLGQLDRGYQGSDAFFAALRRHDLIEPLAVEIPLVDGSVNRLVGFHAINEDRLRELDSAALAELHGEGHLMPVFMALASLSNLDALIRRKNRRISDG
ncbi:SapC family protein [Stakelama saccharophila]|uniref:SapC family protein n=1 Tax=Stakelama saccharophila TaxID=3075605 RepID=A0ABZ0BB53_9SPHN|nr:SapC family protein [Stakelama sp. W311]WNO54301.1 SapC family protein [Stakelama sp. W311]